MIKTRTRHLTGLVAALALACALVSSGSAVSTGVAGPTLYVMYAMNCTFNIVDDSGKLVSAVAPGSYQLDVRTPLAFGTVPVAGLPANDFTACKGFPQFSFTGPGVSVVTTMTAGCEADKTFPVTLAPSATYTAIDQNQPAVARATFTTLATGTPAAPPVTYTNSGNGKTQLSTSIVGEGAVRGTLQGTLSPKGLLTLTNGTKAITRLAAGKYSFAITDRDPKASFMILGPKASAGVNLSGVTFVGKHTTTVRLTAGRWTYYTPALRTVHSFVVSSSA